MEQILISGVGVTCDAGMKTDLASVPRIAWAVIAPWDVARAAVIHKIDAIQKKEKTYE